MKPEAESVSLDDRASIAPRALKIRVSGRVQGVGFRPFVYRLAARHAITGRVKNCTGDVEILACGNPEDIDRFVDDIVACAPPLARPRVSSAEPANFDANGCFEIVGSTGDSDPKIFVPPDYFLCDDCLEELRDPANRRYRYPFINCTQCGPRYTLITALQPVLL